MTGAPRMRVPAVVGSFPEPFAARHRRQAPAGPRWSAPTPAARRATGRPERLAAFDVPVAPRAAWQRRASRRRCASSSGRGPRCATTTRVDAARARPGGQRRLRAPRRRRARDRGARRARARPSRTLGAGHRPGRRHRGRATSGPSWVVTGTDDGGRRGAARALRRGRRCSNRFAAGGRRTTAPSRCRRRPMSYRAPGQPAARRARGGRRRLLRRARRLRRCAFEHPLVLARARRRRRSAPRPPPASGARCARSARYTLPLALVVAVVNALVVRDGLTVFARLGEVPPFGQVDLTLEALVYGLVLGVRVVVIIALLRAVHRRRRPRRAAARCSAASRLRSALTAALATRLVPVLDARRAGAWPTRTPAGRGRRRRASRCCARWPPARSTARSTSPPRSRSAATAPRGRARPRRARRGRATTSPSRPPRVALVVLAVAARAGRLRLVRRPTRRCTRRWAPASSLLAGALVVVALAPFPDRRGIEP